MTTKIPKNNLAARINAMFMGMLLQGLQRRQQSKKPKNKVQMPSRYGKSGYLQETGTRQGERIARQIAKGQLKKENGLCAAQAR